MMLFLVFDVVHQSLLCFNGFCESRIATLPTIKLWEDPFIFDKITACQFDILDQSSRRNCGMDMRQNMQMILHSIDPIEMAVFIIEQLVDVGKKSFPLILNQGGLSVFGRKDKMVKNLCVSTHKSVD